MGYLTNAIKALFTRNTTNAASVSGARIPIVEQNGSPIGNDSMANLAAVLGVNPAAGSQRLEYAMVPANTSYTFSGGYGLLVISNHSSGTTALYTVRHQVRLSISYLL